MAWLILAAWLTIAIGIVLLGDKLRHPTLVGIGAAMVLMLAAVCGVIAA
jgi:hypothetical protein